MPTYRVEARGKKFRIESDRVLTDQELLAHVGTLRQAPRESFGEIREAPGALTHAWEALKEPYVAKHPGESWMDFLVSRGLSAVSSPFKAGAEVIAPALEKAGVHPQLSREIGETALQIPLAFLGGRSGLRPVVEQIVKRPEPPPRLALPAPEAEAPRRILPSGPPMEAGPMERVRQIMVPPRERGSFTVKESGALEPKHYIAKPEGEHLAAVSKIEEGVRPIPEGPSALSRRQKVAEPSDVAIVGKQNNIVEGNPVGGGDIRFEGPPSPFDGKTPFDPAVPERLTIPETHWQRIKSIFSEQAREVKDKLPKELPITLKRPNSPIMNEVFRTVDNIIDDMDRALSSEPFKARLKYSPEDWTRWEYEAYRTAKAGGDPFSVFPEDARALVRQVYDLRLADNAALEELGLTSQVGEFGPVYLPHVIEAEASEMLKIPEHYGPFYQHLATTVKGFQKSRTHATMMEGIAAGSDYIHPADAILYRFAASSRLQRTADLMRNLKGRVLFDSSQEAKAFALREGVESKFIQPTRITNLPGPVGKEWWTPLREEAAFLVDNLTRVPRSSLMGNLTSWMNTFFRSPNLVNPMPHIFGNMLPKYYLAKGNPLRLGKDVVEWYRGTNPQMLERFNNSFPFHAPHAETFGQIIRDAEVAKPGTIGRFARKALGSLNKFSSNMIFRYADPAMRYSLWKQYVRRGFSDIEASNNVLVDLVNYATRSEWVDFWKSIPGNFFVPWRTGVYTTFIKAMMTHPLRTATVIGGIDYLRESFYRHTGVWKHLPWDYVEGPLAALVNDPRYLNIFLTGLKTATFGPGPDPAINNLMNVLEMLHNTDEWPRILNMFWGIGQVFELGRDVEQFTQDGNPAHLATALLKAMTGARETLPRTPRDRPLIPHRLTQFLPEELPGLEKSGDVRRAEEIWEKRERARAKRSEKRWERAFERLTGR